MCAYVDFYFIIMFAVNFIAMQFCKLLFLVNHPILQSNITMKIIL